MLKIREMLRLSHDAALSQNQIAQALRTAKGSVNETLKRFKASEVTWPLPEGMKDSDLFAILYGAPKSILRDFAMPDLEASERSMSEPGASIQRLYEDFQRRIRKGLSEANSSKWWARISSVKTSIYGWIESPVRSSTSILPGPCCAFILPQA